MKQLKVVGPKRVFDIYGQKEWEMVIYYDTKVLKKRSKDRKVWKTVKEIILKKENQ